MHEEHTDFRTIIGTHMPEFLEIIDKAKRENTVAHLEFDDDSSNNITVLLYICTLYAKEQGVDLTISHRRNSLPPQGD